jgi:hypothetical protein
MASQNRSRTLGTSCTPGCSKDTRDKPLIFETRNVYTTSQDTLSDLVIRERERERGKERGGERTLG